MPGFLQRGEGELVQSVLGLTKDALYEACQQTAWLMLPSLAPADALSRIGKDRAIVRGLFEPAAGYRERLIAWRYPRGHRIRGTATALLEQLAAALRGTEYTTIDARGTKYQSGVALPAARGVTWNWDGAEGANIGAQWARYWLVVKSSGAPWPSFTDGAWGPTIGNPDVCIGGSGIHPGEISAVRALVSPLRLGWSPAGRRPVYLTIYFPGSAFPVPDGTWDDWANRDPAYRYVPLHSSVT